MERVIARRVNSVSFINKARAVKGAEYAQGRTITIIAGS